MIGDVDNPLVSIIIPLYNASLYINDALESVLIQTYPRCEVVVFDDCSTDDSYSIVIDWITVFSSKSIDLHLLKSSKSCPGGPGYARNEAILSSHGDYICHLDADDFMDSRRVEYQLKAALIKGKNCLLGCNFVRYPISSTPYYTDWLNAMTDEELLIHQYRECTIISPSWFYHKDVYNKIGLVRSNTGRAFVETSDDENIKRVPEDTYFFMDHLQSGGTVSKVAETLVTYRYTPGSWALGTRKQDLQRVRLKYLEANVLSTWTSFMIYGFGKDAKKIYNMLSLEMKDKVLTFCDVDSNKIGRLHYCKETKKHRKVISFQQLTAPFIVCVGSKRFGGQVESNISSLGFTEIIHFIPFC